jgi:hypothetical protein
MGRNMFSHTTGEHILRVFKDKVPKKMFGSKREEGMGRWRRLYNKEFHKLYASSSTIKVIKSRRMRRGCSTHGTDEKCIQNFGWRT